jgi:hypothetical protein
MTIGESICRESLAAPVPNPDIAALLYQSHRIGHGARQSTPLPTPLALAAIKNEGVSAAVMQAHSAVDPVVLTKLMSDQRVAVKEALATNNHLRPEDYRRLWLFAFEGQRFEMVCSLAERIDLAWVLAQGLAGTWASRKIWDTIARRVIDSGNPVLLEAACRQNRLELAAKVMAMVAMRDLAEFTELIERLDPPMTLLSQILHRDFCPTSEVALITVSHMTADYKKTAAFHSVIRGWSYVDREWNGLTLAWEYRTDSHKFVATIMGLINDETLNVADIVGVLSRNTVAWAAVNERIAEDLGGNPRLWAAFLRLCDTNGTSSLPALLKETLATENV